MPAVYAAAAASTDIWRDCASCASGSAQRSGSPSVARRMTGTELAAGGFIWKSSITFRIDSPVGVSLAGPLLLSSCEIVVALLSARVGVLVMRGHTGSVPCAYV